MSQRTREAYDRWAKTYDTEPNPQIFMEYEEVVAHVDPRKGDSILDAACGTGKYTVEFYKAGAEVIDIDFSFGMLEREG